MADTLIFDDRELQAWIDKLRDLVGGAIFDKLLLQGGELVGVAIEEMIREYPDPQQTLKFRNRLYDRVHQTADPKLNGQPFQSRFVSLKQQRKVFAMIRDGNIPYTRTGNLGRAMQSSAALVPDGVQVTAGTAQGLAPYAPYVIGLPTEQALVHQGIWQSLPLAVEDNVARLAGIMTGFIRTSFDQYAGQL